MTQLDPDQTPQRNPGGNKDGAPQTRPKVGLPLIILALVLFALVATMLRKANEDARPLSDIRAQIESGTVEEVTVTSSEVKIRFREGKGVDPKTGKAVPDGRLWVSEITTDQSADSLQKLVEEAYAEQLITAYKNVKSDDQFNSILLVWILPFVAIGFIFWFLLRRMGPPQGVMNFGKSKAKVYAEKEVHVTFDDVAGCDEAVEEVREIVEFLQEPKKFQALGARIPKGVLLLGAPGTGKTLLARAVAGEAAVPFFSLSGSDFVEMFVGVGASRVRDLFQQAEAQAPCLVFIDELDALGKTRGSSPISNDEREQTLNALLVEMDGFDANNGVILIAATNRPEILDPALMRAGRFDRQIVVDRPDVVGRKKILDVHARKVKLDDSVNLEVIAKRTPGFSGADLANTINEAALLAARREKKAVSMAELEEAIDRVMTGLERRRRGMTEHEKDIVAAHESGHAIVGYFSPGTDPVHRISIIPRGVGTGGHTLFLPDEEKALYTRKELIARITALLGGRAAEKVVYDHYSTGASNDLEVATRIARHMVTRYGMSELVGPVSLESEQSQFLQGSFQAPVRAFSDDTQHAIDGEVRGMIERCERRAIEILEEHRPSLDLLRDVLMEKEVVEGEEFVGLMEGNGHVKAGAVAAAEPTTAAAEAASEDATPASEELTASADDLTETKDPVEPAEAPAAE